MKNVISSFANCVRSGKITLEEIPERYREKVEEKLNETKKENEK